MGSIWRPRSMWELRLRILQTGRTGRVAFKLHLDKVPNMIFLTSFCTCMKVQCAARQMLCNHKSLTLKQHVLWPFCWVSHYQICDVWAIKTCREKQTSKRTVCSLPLPAHNDSRFYLPFKVQPGWTDKSGVEWSVSDRTFLIRGLQIRRAQEHDYFHFLPTLYHQTVWSDQMCQYDACE